MKTLKKLREEIFSQKGAGMLEYALLFGFVAAVFLVVVVLGGFGETLGNLSRSGDDIAKVNQNSDSNSSSDSNLISTSSSDSGETSSAAETSNAAETNPPVYKTLNWQEIIDGVTKTRGTAQSMYAAIVDKDKESNSPDKALTSEINLFGQIITMTEGYLSSTKAEDGLKDWQTFMSRIEKTQKQYNFKSSYKNGDKTVSIERLGNSNAVQIKYSNKGNVTYYKIAPDANNVMQVETNSNKSYYEFFAPIMSEKGWEYNT